MTETNLPTPDNKKSLSMISLVIKDLKVLHAAYMQIIDSGGLFVPTNKPYSLGDELQIKLSILNEKEHFTVQGKVVWITPKNAQGGRAAGIGAAFMGDNAVLLKEKIESYLNDMLDSDHPTHTT